MLASTPEATTPQQDFIKANASMLQFNTHKNPVFDFARSLAIAENPAAICLSCHVSLSREVIPSRSTPATPIAPDDNDFWSMLNGAVKEYRPLF